MNRRRRSPMCPFSPRSSSAFLALIPSRSVLTLGRPAAASQASNVRLSGGQMLDECFILPKNPVS